MTLAVNDVLDRINEVTRLAQRQGGFVVSSSIVGKKVQQPLATVTIRVPSGRFDETVAELRRLAVRVLSEKTSSQDVTEEYVDLDARVRNLEETERQLLKLMERAFTVEDVLKVQRELTNVRGEIERIRGRMSYLERVSAEAVITVHLEPASSSGPLVPRGWSPKETVKSAARGLTGGGQTLLDFLIRLVILAPLWLLPIALIVAAFWLAAKVFRWLRKRW